MKWRRIIAGLGLFSHVERLRCVLAMHNRVIQGEPWQMDWPSTWQVKGVDEQEWAKLQADVRGEYNMLRDGIEANIDWGNRVQNGDGECNLILHTK